MKRYDNEYPSVTEVLPEQKFFCTDEELEAARSEGIDIHADIKLFLDTGDTFRLLHVEAFRRFQIEHKAMLGKLLIYEKSITDHKLKLNGTPDQLYEKANLDIKRSLGTPRFRALQFAGYNILRPAAGLKPTKKWFVLVYDGENFIPTNVYNPEAEQIFLALLTRHRINNAIDNYFKLI